MDQLLSQKFNSVALINRIITDTIRDYGPGEYRFSGRNPKEAAEYDSFAESFIASSMPELSRLGTCMKAIVVALDETDRKSNENSNANMWSLADPLINLNDACVAFLIANQ